MANNPKDARERAEGRFKKPTDQDKANARAEYDAAAQAVRERSARLKALRLAKEAEGEQAAAAKDASAKGRSAAKKSATKRGKRAT